MGKASPLRALLLVLVPVSAIENGLGRTPPMGWRSWNLFGPNVNQDLMEKTMEAMVSRKRSVDGEPTSLCDLGYCDVGLDDNWQLCGAGADGYSYHDADGRPIVNTSRFPSMRSMVDKAHHLNLTAGWYMNNCICRERKNATLDMYIKDVDALVNVFDFDGVKLDGCGTQLDVGLWSELARFMRPQRPVLIENCHQAPQVPSQDTCPWNFYRTSGDVRASYGSVIGNLLTTVSWAQSNFSRPGCWAYPDMLEVGVKNGAAHELDVGLTMAETRSHFGAWCIVSAPLTLSHDVNDDTIMDTVWPIISNRDAIAVNQAWAGHSGSPFKTSDAVVLLDDYTHVVNGVVTPHTDPVPEWQYFYKPLGQGRVAVLMMNHSPVKQQLELEFADVPGLPPGSAKLRDVWETKDIGEFKASFSAEVDSHDCAFLILSPAGRGGTVFHA